jgi:PPOX class probable F420-dependent enzyme
MARTIATNTKADRADLIEFVRPRHRFVLITRRGNGDPQASPVTGGVDDSGRLVIATYPERAKTRNARANAAVSVLVLSDEWSGPWVHLDGTCEVLDVPEALDAFVDQFDGDRLGGLPQPGRVQRVRAWRKGRPERASRP